MDKKVNKYSLYYQILFNKPLRMTESKCIYGFRLMEDKLEHKPFSEKRLLEYIVEEYSARLFLMIYITGILRAIWIIYGLTLKVMNISMACKRGYTRMMLP